MKKLFALVTFILSGTFLFAQDSTATYIENLSVQDSTEIKAQMQGAAEQTSASGSYNTLIFLIVAVVVLLGVFIMLRKKKKK